MVTFVEWLWSLFERGLSMALVGPVWTGFLEIMAGFWEGVNKCLGTLLDHVSQSTIDAVYRMGVCVIVLLLCVVVIRFQNALEYAISCPIMVTKSIVAGICTVITWSHLTTGKPGLIPVISASPHDLSAPLVFQPLLPLPVKSFCLRPTTRGTPCNQHTFDNKPCRQHKTAKQLHIHT